jgi:VWFA-related protein
MLPSKKLLFGSALTACTLLAQSPAPAPAPLAKLITLNVVARDSHDQPVADLGSDDFQVSDQGKPQHITVYRPQDRRQLAAPPGSHQDTSRSTPPHTVVILFDLLNANISYRGYGMDEIEKSMQKLESSDNVYLYLITSNGALYPVRGLPGPDADQNPVDGPWTRQIKPRLDAAVQAVFGFKPVDERVPAQRVEATYHALDLMGLQLSPLPGRKDVIWITHGVPITVRLINNDQPYDFTPELHRLATKLDRAGVTINTVDQGDAVGTGSKETIEEFPNVTGGKAYSQGNVDKAITEVLEAPRSIYVIEYPAPDPDGKYHKVRVTTPRKGVHLQAEQSYLASR